MKDEIIQEISETMKPLVIEVQQLQKLVHKLAIVPVTIVGLVGTGWLMSKGSINEYVMMVLIVLFISPYYPLASNVMGRILNGRYKAID